MAEMTDVGGPLWWLERLHVDLSRRAAGLAEWDDWYSGRHPLPFLTKAHNAKMRNEFLQMIEDSRANFMRMVVDVTEERLRVEGFRLSASEDQTADRGAWDIWQANQMDSESQTAFVEAMVKGVSYLSVWSGDVFPSIAVEDPTQTIVGYEPGSNFRRRSAALKVWRDEQMGLDRANVYMPDGIYKFAAKSSEEMRAHAYGPAASFGEEAARKWKQLDGPDGYVANPVGVVPVVPLRNRPRLLVEGESDLSDVYRIQAQINGFLFLEALAGYMGAHKQRWAIGLTLMEDDKGRPVEPFDVAIDKLWISENPEAKFGEFEQTDLSGYISAIEQKVQHIAILSRTPKHLLLPEGQEPSGDSLKGAESGLVSKVERKQRPFGEGLEEAIRLARLFAGAPDSPVDSEVVWADPRVRTEAEITDAAIKKFAAGLVSREQALEDMGYTPQQIQRMTATVGEPPPMEPAAVAA